MTITTAVLPTKRLKTMNMTTNDSNSPVQKVQTTSPAAVVAAVQGTAGPPVLETPDDESEVGWRCFVREPDGESEDYTPPPNCTPPPTLTDHDLDSGDVELEGHHLEQGQDDFAAVYGRGRDEVPGLDVQSEGTECLRMDEPFAPQPCEETDAHDTVCTGGRCSLHDHRSAEDIARVRQRRSKCQEDFMLDKAFSIVRHLFCIIHNEKRGCGWRFFNQLVQRLPDDEQHSINDQIISTASKAGKNCNRLLFKDVYDLFRTVPEGKQANKNTRKNTEKTEDEEEHHEKTANEGSIKNPAKAGEYSKKRKGHELFTNYLRGRVGTLTGVRLRRGNIRALFGKLVERSQKKHVGLRVEAITPNGKIRAVNYWALSSLA